MNMKSWQMGATPQELCRALRLAFPGGVSGGGSILHVTYQGAAMEIALQPLPPRILGALRLPRLAVRIRFIDGTPEQRQAMWARLELALRRGGG